MATAKIQTGLRLDEATYEKLKVLAEREGRSMNNLIEQIIRLYLREYEAANPPLPSSQD